MRAAPDRPGLVVLDTSLKVVACNSDAVQILIYPESRDGIADVKSWVTNRIQLCLLDRRSAGSVAFVSEFQSLRRTYKCRSFPLRNGPTLTSSSPAMVLMFERKSSEPTSIAEISKRFGLTPREQEAVRLLVEGLTSKEIAVRMKISPNTVNTLIRLIMVKMNVSNRSGIIGKIVASQE